MPPKSASRKSGNIVLWYHCERCGIYLTNKDKDAHDPVCASKSDESEKPSMECIKSGVLYTSSWESFKLDVEELKEMPTKYLDDLIYISEGAIRLANWCIGQSVQISFCDDSEAVAPIVRSIWPIPERYLTTIFVNEKDYCSKWMKRKGQFLSIKALTNVTIAKAVTLKIITDDSDDKYENKQLRDLERVLKQEIRHLIYTTNSIIEFDFFNRALDLKIIGFEEPGTPSSDDDSLEDAMRGLSLSKERIFFQIVPTTTIQVISESENTKVEDSAEDDSAAMVTKDMIGGLNEQMDLIETSMHYALGLKKPPKGAKMARCVVLYGPSGCGKTLICDALCTELMKSGGGSKTSSAASGVDIIKINTSEIFSKFLGETERNLTAYFERAFKNFPKPTLIVIEDVQTLCAKNDANDLNRRIAVSFASLLDELNNREDAKRTFLLATTSHLDEINSSVRRCGRLDIEIEIGAPSPKGRQEILNCLLRNMSYNLKSEEIEEIARVTHGYVGADLANLLSHASLEAFKMQREVMNFSDIYSSLTFVKPSAMREVLIENPNVHWSDIGGQTELKLQLQQAIEWPTLYPEKFAHLGIKPPRGILMYGPPGCSKTMVAKALATESKLNFISIKGPELFSMWVGESERAVREVFRKARQVAPAIVFFDEIDAIGGERGDSSSGGGTSVKERVLTQLLTELDGVEALENVSIVAATNRPDMIDKALLRPGRIDRIVYVGLPDADARREIFKIKLRKMPISSDVEIEKLVEKTDGYTGAEIQAVCHEAALKTLEESFEAEHVCWRNFESALDLIRPRTSSELLKLYEDYRNKV